ncbi:hypothetical protein CCICO_05160 [Corynebacterium ciconiae DSM 44920]|uniref:DUF3515 domain-containing protein n=1 Tax=Corynebacterium ciconiae TaxID=227319 RepID=UPI000362A00A|nr:DUF3515 domain-containing protein [Corynebacterium ciconiae]WKD61065.1 hypothetical protein CCICO_05160 [Corynebacterium ciconiae DSM 44920]
MSSSPNETPTSDLPRRPIIIALVLSILLTLAVLVGTKLLFGDGRDPVALSELPSEQADSAECSALIDALPQSLNGLEKARLVDPAPAGAFAWSGRDNQRITLRCGVQAPAQYTTMARTEDINGRQWLRVKDATTGSTMQTWYLVGATPTVAVTADAESLKDAANPVEGLGDALSPIDGEALAPAAAPLSQLDSPAADAASCQTYQQALPTVLETSSGSYRQIKGSEVEAAGYPRKPDNTVVWMPDDDGLEPIITRCGVAEPAGYEPGQQLQQVNDIPWFNDTTLANGTTQGVWYALGRDVAIAVAMPQAVGQTVFVEVGNVIAETTETVAR